MRKPNLLKLLFAILTAFALSPNELVASEEFQESCVREAGTPVDMAIIQGELISGDIKLWNNMWGIRGHKNDDLEQCLFTDGDDLGWRWRKGTTDRTCCAPEGQGCQFPFCMFQFSFPSLNYGVDPWGNGTGAPDLPASVANLQSLVVEHDITYEAIDVMPGTPAQIFTPYYPYGSPFPIYARHSLIYDLFLTTEKPAEGVDVSASATDEMLIFLNYNPEYPDEEACSLTVSEPIEAKAVFDGHHYYDYHTFSPFNVIGRNYHQFRLVGGDSPDNPIPQRVDLVPFLRYLKERYQQPDLWVGKIVMGTQTYDHTQGSVTFHDGPDFDVDACDCPQVADATCTTGFDRGMLAIDASDPGNERLRARMTGGPRLTQKDMGNPIGATGGDTSYSVCLYDESSELAGSLCVDRTDDFCNGKPCWRQIGSRRTPSRKGYAYKDSKAETGIQRLWYRSGKDGHSRLIVKGRGPNIQSGLPAALASSEEVTVQVRSSDAQCLSVTLDDVRKSDDDRYTIRKSRPKVVSRDRVGSWNWK